MNSDTWLPDRLISDSGSERRRGPTQDCTKGAGDASGEDPPPVSGLGRQAGSRTEKLGG
ncbi:hypothetical protein JZ751_024933, partial [Albula glossodonta]